MKNNIKVAVMGATGKAGKYLLKQLLRQSFQVKILLRNPASFTMVQAGLEIVQGDARVYESVHELVKGCAAVISTLGQPKGEATIFSQATQNVLRALEAEGIQRYILITGLNVDAPYDQKNAAVRSATEWMRTNYPETTADKQIEFEKLRSSSAQWTMVRLPMIDQTDVQSPVKVALHDCPGDKISATSLAHFLISQLTDETYNRSAPFIANA